MSDRLTRPSPSARLTPAARLLLTVLLAIYGLVIMTGSGFPFIDSVNLAIHETGHLVFGIFGEFVGVLGGTLFQLIVPLAFVIHFARRGDRFGAGILLWWVGENCWNIAGYVRDARAQELPLVGGGGHDWHYLLSRIGLLAHDREVGTMIFVIGVFVFLASITLAVMNLRDRV